MQFLCKKKLQTFASLPQQNLGCTSGSNHRCRYIFQAIMGRRRNELRTAAGLIFKLRIIIAAQGLKIGFYKRSLVPPYLLLVTPHFVCSGDGTG